MKSVQFNEFVVGNGVELEYITPSSGTVVINLVAQNDKDCVFHFSMRFNERVLVFNTKVADRWGREERPPGMNFTPGRMTQVKLVTCPSGINVYMDGNFVQQYNYRHGHTAYSIKSVNWNGPQTAKLDAIKVLYSAN